MFLLQRWCIEKKVGMWIVSVIIKMVYKRMNPDTRWKEKFTCWYIRGRKNTVEVCSCGEHSIWKHSQVIIMQHSISTVFIWLDILTITEIKHQSNRYIILQLIQIYNITAYTITDTVNIQQRSVSDTHCPQSVLYRGTGIKDRIVHAITVNKEWWVNNQAAI